MMSHFRIIAGFIFTLAFVMLTSSAMAGQGQIDEPQPRRLVAVRALGSLTIDGMLDEVDWGRAPVAKGFVQNEPREGEPATEDTEVRVLYDADSLYIGIFARDNEPQHIITSELTKDFNRTGGDDVEIVLDTFHDERNGYVFATNAWGAKFDAQMVNEGREVNENWDALWSVKTRIAETGWFAEIAIPFRTLRFADADPQTWGINFERRIRRKNEDTFWAPLPRIYDLQRVSLAGTLEGLQGLRAGNDLRVKPYVLGSSGKSTRADVGNDYDLGLDVKYGVTKGLTWDFTLNTDFSQVEADEQQINLSRFSLFFPEKRDFFLENSGVFQFGQGNERGGGGNGGPNGSGNAAGGRPGSPRDPVLFFSRRIGLSDAGNAIPILGGTRLTGRAGPYTLGVLNIQQKSFDTSLATNFTALRLRRDVLGNADIGAVFLNKDVEGPRYNRVLAADANFRFFRNFNISTYAARAFSPESVVGSRGSDTMARAGFNYRGPFWEYRAAYATIGERFNDEMGFFDRIGVDKANAYVATHTRPKLTSRWAREIYPHVDYLNINYAGGGLQTRNVDYHVPIDFQDGSWMELGLNVSSESLRAPFLINRRRNVIIAPGRYDFHEWFTTWKSDPSKPMAVSGRWGVGNFYDGYKQNYQLGTALRLSSRLNALASISRNQIDLVGGKYATNLITTRVDYAFSTTAFVNALLQYNTDVHEWSSNVRFNLIHRPLSDFFLVLNERRDSDNGILLDRALIAKMTYMVAF
jgi:hypothetical protein